MHVHVVDVVVTAQRNFFFNTYIILKKIFFLTLFQTHLSSLQVEHIIREDYLVEGMEIVELYLDLLLARLGLIQATKTLDPGIAEAVASVIWVTPRLSAEVAELKSVSHILPTSYLIIII